LEAKENNMNYSEILKKIRITADTLVTVRCEGDKRFLRLECDGEVKEFELETRPDSDEAWAV
jgi:hypothetical protein